MYLPAGRSLPAVITAATTTDNGIDLELGGSDEPLCTSGCEDLSVVGTTPIRSSVEIVPVTVGPVIPISALEVQPSGTTTVMLASGETRPVEIVSEDRGLAVVAGIAPGSEILLPSAEG